MTSLIFVIFYNYLFFVGKSFIHLFSQKNRLIEEINLDIYYEKFYPVVSLFLIGNLAVLLNYFVSIKSAVYFIFIVTLIPILIFNKKLFDGFNAKLFIKNIVFPGILSMSVYASRLHYDAGAYHLNNQLWIRESKLVIGLSNLIQNYGFSSINEYLSSLLWFQIDWILWFVL